MTSTQLKKHLLNNPDIIIRVLEELDCHSIKHIPNKRIMAALPDGDNATSIQILLENEMLITVVHTRSDYKGGDIFNFIEYMKGCSFRNAFMFIARISNVKIDFTYKPKVKNETFEFLSKFTKGGLRVDSEENIALDESVLNEYIKTAHQMFLDDNLSIDSQYKFGIHYDLYGQRILIPIKDLEGNLITIKGRTVVEDYDDKGIEKYIAYYPYHARKLLYGYYENYWDILKKNEIILVESEKAVIQADGYGINNAVAISKKKISDEQLYRIISLNVDVVLAFDKDVSLEELKAMSEEFKGLCRVYAIYDIKGLLNGKDSPFDKGETTWNELYKNKIRIL